MDAPTDTPDFEALRAAMVREQLAGRDITDQRVLDAMGRLPRERFVPEAYQAYAYADHPLPIGEGQTISQPYIVAYMLQMLALRGTERVLEVGTGSGYQTALLCMLAAQVISIERIETLSAQAAERLAALGLTNVHLIVGDGWLGAPQYAPYQAITVSAAAARLPKPLLAQLDEGGRMVIPVRERHNQEEQALIYLRRTRCGLRAKKLCGVRFVPLISDQAAADQSN
ncbi:MAG: protein-L-isoaspartate(D-aspartate) O-methyltransferase [Anaerolineae bacterium]|nr:protein-L-isoaspartate(D-aspartate) O-methyltransferase [Anaerolineae bacterium]MDW8299814.1 protein-L-isoaspartate(D-aspartate) O-methyltransferase [Anaerolineae bacterium]